MAPFLARLLDDPYYAVRWQAFRALRSLPGGAEGTKGYSFLAGAEEAATFREEITDRWRRRHDGGVLPAVLIDEGGLRTNDFQRLFAARDDRPVYLSE
jgi:hypothetical protein